MLVSKIDKSFISRSDKPNENWLNDDDYFVIEDNSELYHKIIKYSNNGGFEFVYDKDTYELIDVEPLVPEVNQDEINCDLDFRLCCIELGLV